jgi:alkanesulfonate monooxygenase SsuD/methylene tetrahydromethanopterin reductase-like flavin-dependent oxidoreductase (luciferase family)
MIKVHALGVTGHPDLRDQIRLLETAGLDGFFVTDHLFVTAGRPRREADRGSDPFVRLAIAGALSEKLMLGSCVVNIGLAHPALAIRSFLALAAQFGGERVIAGIGAGWNPEEFTALGLDFPPFATRLDRLEETTALARDLFYDGFADLAGTHITAQELALGPVPASPPRLLLGGGSDRLLDIAGLHADIVDLNASSRGLKLAGAHPVFRDNVRRLRTTVDDLDWSVSRVRETAIAAGRDPASVEFSLLVNAVRFCSAREVENVESELCRSAEIDQQSLADCPYLFIGPPERMREQLLERANRLGLGHLILTPAAAEVLGRFREEVVAVVG